MQAYAVGLRTHKDDALTRASLDKLVGSLGADRVVLVFDDTHATPPRHVPHGVRVLRISEAAALGLDLGFDGAGWLCGDYAHYLMQDRLPHVAATWVVEPDVGFGRLDPAALFDAAAELDADFIAHNMGEADPDWYWTPRLERYGFQRKGHCLYGLNRLSRRAGEACRDRRLTIQQEPGYRDLPLNDESLTASTVLEEGFSTALLKDVVPLGPFRCSGARIPDFVARRVLPDKVAHPVVTTGAALKYWTDGAERVVRRQWGRLGVGR